MSRIKITLAIVVAGLCINDAVIADTVALISQRDNTLYQDANGALSNGVGEFFFSGTTGNGVIRRGLVFFDVAGGVPAGATINSATLTLHMSMTSGGATNVELHRLLANWGEGASNAPGGEGAGTAAAPGDATWLHTFFNGSLWANAGGDFDASASALTSVDAVGFYSWNSPGLTLDVQNWFSNPSANFGWLLKGDESQLTTSKRFDTRESLTADFRPMLMIDYTPVPAPGAMSMLLVGFLAGSRRRIA